jgi:hypothetical protein
VALVSWRSAVQAEQVFFNEPLLLFVSVENLKPQFLRSRGIAPSRHCN